MKQVRTLSYDFYLMINDDVLFFENALQTMVSVKSDAYLKVKRRLVAMLAVAISRQSF